MTNNKHTKILMPALSPTMENGKLVKWNIKVGDTIQAGDYIADVETDKAVIEMESMHKGVVSDLIAEGTSGLSIGALIGIMIPSADSATVKIEDVQMQSVNSDASQIQQDQVSQNAPQKADAIHLSDVQKHPIHNNAPSDVPIKIQTKIQTSKQGNMHNNMGNITGNMQGNNAQQGKQPEAMGSRIVATPIAKKIAYQNNIDLSHINGSGPRGRIRKADVLAISMSTQAQNMPRLQGLIADRMVYAKQSVPHFYMDQQINAEHIIKLKDTLSKNAKVTINDILIKIVARAIAELPHINVNYVDGNRIKYRDTVDIGFAVGIPEGVLTPVVENADKISIFDIALLTKDKIKSIKGGDYTASSNNGSATISNMGMFGIDRFYSIINQPMPFAVAIGGFVDSFKVNDGKIDAFKAINITISVDHRVINGVDAAQFINKIKEFAHDPVLLLI